MASSYRTLLEDNQRDTVNILIPDIDPEILKKVVEYIYIGFINLDSKYMSGMTLNLTVVIDQILISFLPPIDFIEACNLLQLKASITCERKLVFDNVPKRAFSAKATSTPIPIVVKQTQQSNLDSLIADLEQEEHLDYEMKAEHTDDTEQVIYEISNFEDAEITYEEADENEDMSDEPYELVNVVPESISDVVSDPKTERKKKIKIEVSDIKSRSPAKPVDEEMLGIAIKEIISNSSRLVV